jgi:hypothetical protein
MAKVWVLDTETKGTGANVVPLEKVARPPHEREAPPEKPAERRERPKRARRAEDRAGEASAPRPRRPKPEPERSATALPPGHVRKKATGEIGKVLAVDARAGTATVQWLRSGGTSTLPLSAVARR